MREPSDPGVKVGADPVLLAHPAGQKLRTTQGRWGIATATFDEQEIYRFRLSRVWGPEGSGRICWIMLNPSTATEQETDPTVERTLRFARSWGHSAAEVVNVFALRSTDPKRLREMDDPVGPGNDEAIVAAAEAADLVVVAWGVHAVLRNREQEVAELLANAGVRPKCLHITRGGHPGHPLYLPNTSEPRAWPGPST